MGKLGVWAMSLGAFALCCLTAVAAPADVDKLIDQMASGKFKDREAAYKQLEQIGSPALEALRKAAMSEDADLAQRAKDLIKAIEKKGDTAEILKPTMVKLNYKDTPIQKVCEDLTKQTGYQISAQGDPKKLEEKKVTIETKEITLWEAIDQLCLKAELTHQTQAVGFGPGGPGGVPQPDIDLPIRGKEVPIAPGGRPRPIRPGEGFNPNQIVLTDAKPVAYPTAYCGAIRIRAVPSANFQNGIPMEKDEALMAFEVVAEPKLQILSMSVRLEKAVDEKDQKVEPLAMELDRNGGNGIEDGIIIQNGNGIIVKGNVAMARDLKLRVAPFPGQGYGPQIVTAKVKLPENAKAIKEMSGVLVLQVQGQSQITVDDLASAKGKTFKSKDGKEIKILEVKKLENGQTEVQVEMEAQQGGGFDGGPRPFPGGGIRIQPALPINPVDPAVPNVLPRQIELPGAFAIEDVIDVAPAQGQGGQAAPGNAGKAQPAQQAVPVEVQPVPPGKPLPPGGIGGRPAPGYGGGEQFQAWTKDGKPCGVGVQAIDGKKEGGKVLMVYKLIVQAPEKGEAAKLVFNTPKQSTIEVPFELKNVPMK